MELVSLLSKYGELLYCTVQPADGSAYDQTDGGANGCASPCRHKGVLRLCPESHFMPHQHYLGSWAIATFVHNGPAAECVSKGQLLSLVSMRIRTLPRAAQLRGAPSATVELKRNRAGQDAAAMPAAKLTTRILECLVGCDHPLARNLC